MARRHRHPDQVLGRRHRLGVGPRRLDGAADAAEQIDLIGDVELAVEGPAGRGLGAPERGHQIVG